MNETTIVGDDAELTTDELCRICRTSEVQIETWVVEGVLEASGGSRESWRFRASAVRRLRTANRLARDLEINAAGVAVALDLLDRIAELERRLQRLAPPSGRSS